MAGMVKGKLSSETSMHMISLKLLMSLKNKNERDHKVLSKVQ